MRTRNRLAGVAILVVTGCADDWPEPRPISRETLLAEHEEWRLDRQRGLVTPPGGAVLWIGLWALPQGSTEFGSDGSLSIVLPREDSPPIAGTLRRTGQEVMLEPAPGSGIQVRRQDPDDEEATIETPVSEPLSLRDDGSSKRPVLVLGSIGFRLHFEPGTDRLWLRAWDEDSPKRVTFTLPDYFPIRDRWRVAARLTPYDEPALLRFPDVTGGEVEYRVPGKLHFQIDGREHTLIPTVSENSTTYLVLMWDSTATVNTYHAGRYLRVDFPDEHGWTTIDFNRTYNAPCVFSAYSVCGLPPKENRLDLHVTAGEQRPKTPDTRPAVR